MITRVRALALACVTASIAFPQTSDAAGRPVPQRQVRTVAVPAALAWRPVHTGPHRVYGQIRAIARNMVYIQRRNGRLFAVNAAGAIAHGDYSAPLYIGKLVSVDGDLQRGVFVAAHIFRLESLDQLPSDR